MTCEDAPCCGCCTPQTMQDQYEAEEAYWEMQEAGYYPGEDMDGDFDSGMASAGFGTDEDYGGYGGEDWF